MKQSQLRYVILVVALAGAYVATGMLGQMLAFGHANVSLLWLPSGISLAALLVGGRRLWPGVAIGAGAVTLLEGNSAGVSFGLALGNTVAAVVGSYWLDRAGFQKSLARLHDVLLFAVVGACASRLVSTTIGTVTLLLAGGVDADGALAVAVVYWTGGAMGILLVTPLVLSWACPDDGRTRSFLDMEALALAAALLAGTSIVFGSPLPLGSNVSTGKYLLFPLIIWAALRLGPRGAATTVMIVWVTALPSLLEAGGHHEALALQQNLAHLQLFVGVASLTGLTVSAVIAERQRAELELVRARGDLERKVEERTRGLVGANAQLQVEMAERAGAEARLRESQKAVERIANTTPSMLSVFDIADGRFVYSNARVEHILGITPERTATLDAAGLARLVDPDDLERLQGVASRLATAEDGEFVEAEFRMRDAGGAYRWLHARGTVFARAADGSPRQLLATILDITDRRRAEDRVLEAERRAVIEYEALLGKIAMLAQTLGMARDLLSIYRGVREFAAASVPSDAVFIGLYDPRRDERIAAYACGDGEEIDVSGLPPMPVTSGPNSDAIRRAEAVISNDYARRMKGRPHVVIDTKQSEKMPRSSLAVPMVVMGRVVGTIEVQSYEPDAYRKEHATAIGLAANLAAVAIENTRLLERETLARNQAEKSNRLKDEFLATLSHELRTPLNAMLGWIHMLRGGNLDADMQRRAIETVERNARAQAQLIEDILDVSRIITGKLRVTVRDSDLAAVIAASADAVRIAAEAKEIALEIVVDESASRVVGDPDRLQQVVWNLLSNAIKFTPKGGRVMLRLDRDGDSAAITVADTGEGIEPEFLPFVFDRFRQADSSMKRSHGGLGLGLAIVRHIAEIHGGSASAFSAGPDRGSTFVVRLPLAAEARAARPTAPIPTAEPPASDPGDNEELGDVRVLVVDDEADARDVLAIVLEKRGAEVRAAGSAAEALAALDGWVPDVIVSDIGMPGEDGFDLIAKIRSLSEERGGAAPAIALTAYARAEDRERVHEAGFQLHIGKPTEPDVVVAAVADLAGRSRAANV
jgi:PAS domain S-box-containing protein